MARFRDLPIAAAGGAAVVGAICKRDVLAHPIATIRCFGWRVFVRTVVARRDRTFLSILTESGQFRSPGELTPGIPQRCVGLELAAKRIYQSLAARFVSLRTVEEFFETLARQEEQHAQLLELCHISAGRTRMEGCGLDAWEERLLGVERQMREAEAKLRAVRSTRDAFCLAIEIESSEINRVFAGVVAASDSEFVRKSQAFRSAGREHLVYIGRTIAAFEPEFAAACERMLSC
jgi:hypothetical protein